MARILILGASGMLGNALLRVLSNTSGHTVIGTTRSYAATELLPAEHRSSILSDVDVENVDSLTRCFGRARPEVVINCVGLVKQAEAADDRLQALALNSVLPHRLARLCQVAAARLVHISTDCVFSGSRGMYKESDFADADDVYGRTKFLGGVAGENAITLRTSIIGHELKGARSLIGWFLAQERRIRGFRRAIFSGLPTVELARLIRDVVLPDDALNGLYHVSAEPISKFDLLTLVASAYGKDIQIEPDDTVLINRSLDSTRFRAVTGFIPKSWPDLVRAMHEFG